MKYFCVSDVHSHYAPLKAALDEAGYDMGNESHALVVCGDVFDRGEETMEVYRFFKSIPEDRLILVKGNHELLYAELLDKRYPDRYDFSNGTVRTFCAIAGVKEADVLASRWKAASPKSTAKDAAAKALSVWAGVKEAVSQSEVTEFMLSDRWRWYFEANGHVFVHAFVPTKIEGKLSEWDELSHIFGVGEETFDPDWRKASDFKWCEAVWDCPWAEFKKGLWGEDGILVTGHRKTSEYFYALDGENGKDDCPLYVSSKGLVGLDAHTYVTGRVNVYVLEG